MSFSQECYCYWLKYSYFEGIREVEERINRKKLIKFYSARRAEAQALKQKRTNNQTNAKAKQKQKF